MTTLSAFRKSYDYFSGKVSEGVRTLSFSAIAIVWIFRVDGGAGTIHFQEDLLDGLMWAVAALLLDFLQYLYGTVAWGVFCRLHERKKVADDKELYANPKINWPTNILFYLKIVFILIAYINLSYFVLAKLQ
jgi:hypothetical protein